MKRLFVLSMGMLLVGAGLATAADLGFENTADGIEKRLLTPAKHRVKTRGFTDPVGAGEVRVRGVTVTKRPAGGEAVVEKTVTVPKQRAGGFVNLAVRFDYDSFVLRPDAIRLLDELGKALNRPSLTGRPMFVNGHADADGTEPYNLGLSLKRAQAVKRFLVNNHVIAAGSLRVMGYGEGLPLVSNTTDENKQINRRVEIVTVE